MEQSNQKPWRMVDVRINGKDVVHLMNAKSKITKTLFVICNQLIATKAIQN